MYLFCIENIKKLKQQLFHFEISRLMSQQYAGMVASKICIKMMAELYHI